MRITFWTMPVAALLATMLVACGPQTDREYVPPVTPQDAPYTDPATPMGDPLRDPVTPMDDPFMDPATPMDDPLMEPAAATGPALISMTILNDETPEILEKLDEMKREFGDSVLFVEADISDDYLMTQSELLMAQLGLKPIFEEKKDRAGMLVLVDPLTREVKDEITHEASEDELRERIASAVRTTADVTAR